MNISNITLVAFIASSTTITALFTTLRQVSSFLMTQQRQLPHRIVSSSTNNAAVLRSTSTTTLHQRDDDKQEPKVAEEVVDINLESLSVPQLQDIYNELEKMNEGCTEDCTQTNAECDIVVKDERDVLMIQIQSIIQERSVEDALSTVVDMELVHSILHTPWTYPLNEIKTIVLQLESLNYQCTEEGHQTNAACDIQLKDERDGAIETLNLYMKSVQNLVADAAEAAATASTHEEKEEAPVVVEKKKRSRAYSTFDMDDIHDCCLYNPGSRSLDTMKAMLTQLESETNACTEDGTQTNPECEIELKAERDALMEVLVHQIQEATSCLNEIQAAFAPQKNINELAMDDIMKTVRNTIATTKKISTTATTNENHHPTTTTTTTTTTFTAPTDEFVIQI
eukprot:CAMPEP_0170798790 /NCGR_PEP_ID=MMETSP0733-20121128/26594_1 /TAXON_ID=186038 /ORGANISM="Fragilariopsis kerguelensis, Strain L26-C5" /LENGTH=395 /DNA_ID=CAMNT_0011150267 /DNA_START=66 /DNA_END=1253 /DNA_ORIENTATION=-